MFGIGGWEMVVIFLLLLFAVGPEKMPTFARAIRKGILQFRSTTQELRKQVGIDELLKDDDIRDPLGMKQVKRDLTKPLSDIRDAGRSVQKQVAQVGASVGKPGAAGVGGVGGVAGTAGAGGAAANLATGGLGTPGTPGIVDADISRVMSELELAAEQPPVGVDLDFAASQAAQSTEPNA